jgi:hypothetical protein
MKLPFAALSSYALSVAITTSAFSAVPPSAVVGRAPPRGVLLPPLRAEIRPPTEKNDVLEYGWDGTTALGKAVVDSKPARLLDQIRASGETQSDACQLFNANLGEGVLHFSSSSSFSFPHSSFFFFFFFFVCLSPEC